MVFTPVSCAKLLARSRASAAPGGGAGRVAAGLAAIAGKTRQLPPHGAVAQRHDAVGHPRAAQAFGSHDAAGAAGAVDDDGGVRIGREFADAIDQLAARHADGAGDGHAPVFLQRPAVQDHHGLAGIQQRLQLGRVQALGAVMVLGPFAEGLGRHVHAGKQDMARGLPGRAAAFQHMHVGVALARQPVCQGGGIALAAIGADDAGGLARHQMGRAQFLLRERAGDGPEQVGTAELPFLARVEDGELLAAPDPRLQRGRGDRCHALACCVAFMKFLL
jgi:hypothetical protein